MDRCAQDWPKAAQQLARLIPPPLNPEWPAVLRRKERIAVACSGGADSLALALLSFVWLKGRIVLAHFNHRVRGKAADWDAAFVRALGKGLGVAVYEASAPRSHSAFDEASLRRMRFDFFKKLAKNNVRIVALAHHADDVVETMLMRLGRGSAQLAAPRFEQALGKLTLVRPLLAVRKAQIVQALTQIGVSWCRDDTNFKPCALRNRLRLNVVPQMARAFAPRDMTGGFLRAHSLLCEDYTALECWLKQILGEGFEKKSALNYGMLAGKPRALFRRALRAWLESHGMGDRLSARGFDALLGAICSGEPFRRSAGTGCCFCSDGKSLELERAFAAAGSNSIWRNRLFCRQTKASNGASLKVELVKLEEALKERIFSGKVLPSSEVFISPKVAPLAVRSWKAGDRYRPLGAPGSRKVQDLFTDKKIPKPERSVLPVVYEKNTGRILWIPGLPPAHYARLLPSAKKALRLTYASA